ncbi:N-acetylmuramoyl-L-alanine amidase [Luteolibacter flavescens]|uniref:N-acetylmuramoyl-L-alanine amidase n=1 Tax=Luteolibacter flavescens TaxID=1859460 RepID=A0ABT3FP39_9BACT|nr:N-acetylmuramoyl-L-alanine amidase [Luteolibacter flavescens]MCW1885343.1 N-acetylmuramoyl-L-alanine amidase [Luteolibacter flavescens]
MPNRFSIPLMLAVLFAWLGASPVARAQWETKQISGRDYISVDGMKKFYGFDSIKRTGNQLLLDKVVVVKNPRTGKPEKQGVLMKLQVGSQECLMNGVKFVFSYKVEDQGGRAWISRIDLTKLVDPVLRPNYIANAGNFKTVIIDAGHGGKDPGATNALGTEAAYNLDIANRLKRMLSDPKLGYKVVMTRDTDRYLTLQERVQIANRVNDNAIFISIHHNSGGSAARGLETFTLSPIGVAHYGRGLNASDFQMRAGNSHDSGNVALATAVHGSLLTLLKEPKTEKSYTLDRGIKRARFSVLTGVKHPAILVECGFMTHPYEARLIHNEAYRNTIAKGITAAVMKYSKAVSKSPAANP